MKTARGRSERATYSPVVTYRCSVAWQWNTPRLAARLRDQQAMRPHIAQPTAPRALIGSAPTRVTATALLSLRPRSPRGAARRLVERRLVRWNDRNLPALSGAQDRQWHGRPDSLLCELSVQIVDAGDRLAGKRDDDVALAEPRIHRRALRLDRCDQHARGHRQVVRAGDEPGNRDVLAGHAHEAAAD